jgi:SNF2 family DNA or RNA helicase
MHQRCFVLNDMGTMKTASVIYAADWLRRIKKIRRVVILSPLSTLEAVWADEIFRITPQASVAVVHGTRKKRLELIQEEHDFYVVNHHGLKIIQDHILPDVDLLIVDEATAYKNSQSQLWKSLNAVLKRPTLWTWMLTGSPMANSPVDAWALAKLVSPGLIPKHFGTWKDRVMYQINQFKWCPQTDAPEKVAAALQPAIRYSREECVDLPDTLTVDRRVELTPEQAKAYKRVQDELAAEINGSHIIAANQGVAAMKLIQVCCGVVYDQDGKHVVVGAAPRIAALKEIIEEAPSKVIVFVPLTGALNHVYEALKDSWTTAVVDGSVSKKQRDEIYRNFQTATDPRVIVAQPQTMSHGLTLTEAATIVWFAPVDNNETYQQACARINRPGQKRNTTIVHLHATALEQKMFKRLEDKASMQGILFDLFKGD